MQARSCLALLLLALFVPAAHAQNDDRLPGAIEDYYRDRNRAAVISTPQERASLANFPGKAELSERLGEVAGLLRSLRAHDLEVDPGMVRPAPGALAHVPAAFSEVAAVRRTAPDRLEVDLIVRSVDPATNFQLIRLYESEKERGREKKMAPAHPSALSPVTSRESHAWRLVDGQWKRYPAAFVLLSQPAH